MGIDRSSFLDTLTDSYSAYYDIYRDEEITELPLAFRADYYSRAEKYWLSKNIPIWGNETNEFCYVFSAPSFDEELSKKCIDYALEDGLPRVKPHKEHQYTNIKVLLVADNFDKNIVKYIQRRKFSKSYRFSFYGFSTLKTAAVDLSEQKAFPNNAGNDLTGYFKKLFAAASKAVL